jgi:hypothetical protein
MSKTSDMHVQQQEEPEWLPIETAPHDRDIRLKAFITPSAAAYQNGSRPHWTYGTGRWLHSNHWSGILGASPSHWMEDIGTKGRNNGEEG